MRLLMMMAVLAVALASAPHGDAGRPSKPTKVRIESASTTSIRVSWNTVRDSTRVSAYRLWVNSRLRTVTKSTAFTVRGLRCGKTYSLSVRTYDQVGNRSSAATISARTARCLPEPQKTSCFASPGACGFPDPARGNVGVPPGVILTPSGSITASRDGQIISGKDVTGTITVTADNVTITNTRVTASGGGGATAIRIDDATGTKITYTTVRGAGTEDPQNIEAAVYGQVALVDHDYFYNCQDCMEQSSGAVVKDSYILVNGSSPDAHYEDIYINLDYGGIDVEHSTLFNIFPQTAVVFGDNVNRSSFTIKNSLLGGGAFMFYADHTAGTIDIEGNRLVRCRTRPFETGVYGNDGRTCAGGGTDPDQGQTPDSNGYYPDGGYFGIFAFSCSGPGLIWSGNVWDDSGAAVSCS